MKVSTGIKNLDSIMGGGFLERSFNLVYGGGGTGKTLFTLNFLLKGAEEGKHVIYVTLEESWDDITRKLPQGMKDRLEKVKDRFHYLDFGSMRPVLGREVLKSDVLLEAITSSIVVHNISLAGLDGIAPISLYYENEKKIRSVIFDISQSLKSYGVTTIFTSEEINGVSRYGVEEYVSDSVIRLIYTGRFRRLQILKTRGSDFVGGLHGFEISTDGLRVYPRVLFSEGKHEIKEESLGIPKLDNMLGVIYSGDVTLLSGPPGTGKYLFGVQFIKSSCAHGKKGVYISFEENSAKIKKRLQDMGENLKNCRVIYIDALEMDMYRLLWVIRDRLKDADRVVFHGINVLSKRDEYPDFVHSLLNYTRRNGIGSMVIYTIPGIIGTNTIGDENVVYMSDNIIRVLFAEINGELKKVLVIIKTHSPTHERGLVEYRLGKRGVIIVGKIEELEGIMSGTPSKQMEIRKRVEKFFK